MLLIWMFKSINFLSDKKKFFIPTVSKLNLQVLLDRICRIWKLEKQLHHKAVNLFSVSVSHDSSYFRLENRIVKDF
jgi:hypothetical protein